jgi:FkbM family methyltransferase
MHRRQFIEGVVTGAVVTTATLGAGTALAARLKDPSEQGRLSFAEQGEDLLLFPVVRDILKVERATYVDVGAAYPVKGNNTYLLYSLGGHGVLVEPNPWFAAQLRTRRPRDQVVEAGIGTSEAGAADYFVIRGNALLNTFSPAQVEALEQTLGDNAVERVVRVPLLTLNRLISERLDAAPDVLSTDVEGLDFDILRTLDLDRLRPGVICAESAWKTSGGADAPLTEYLVSKGYMPRGGSLVNTVYVDGTRRP